jgi:uncharacterized phiE125 gp8 family phage protein
MIVYSRVTEQPDSEPISLDEAKEHLEWVGTSKDNYITSLIKTARRVCEAYSGLSFVTQERVVRLDYFPCYNQNPYRKLWIEVPYGPVQAITMFQYSNDAGGTTTLVEGTDFIVDYHSPVCRIYPLEDGEIGTWPDDVRHIPYAITIGYQTGFDDVSGEPLPEQARQAILLQVAAMFESRQDETVGAVSHKINMNSEAILDTIKVYWNAHTD